MPESLERSHIQNQESRQPEDQSQERKRLIRELEKLQPNSANYGKRMKEKIAARKSVKNTKK